MINLFEPSVGTGSLEMLKKVFASRWLGRGEYVNQFEEKLAVLLKVDRSTIHTISCCSDAIFGAFHVLNISPQTEVIAPSISFPAVGSAILEAGLTPKIVDIDPTTGNIDFFALTKALTKKTSAVLITHYGGIPVDIKKLRSIIGPNIRIIEDAACALGTYIQGQACGTQGDFGCWSFDAMKLLTCGEGGGLFIANPQEMIRVKEYFYLGLPAQAKSGIDRLTQENRWWEYQLNVPGRRSIFTNVNAAIGLPQFDTLKASLLRREQIRQYYCSVLDQVGQGLYLEQNESGITYSNYFFTVVHKQRDALAKSLKEDGIYSTFRYYPLHNIDIFKPYAEDCPGAERFSEMAVNIPIHQALSDSDVELIGDSLKRFFTKY